MPKYLFYGSFTPKVFIGLVEEGGSKRIEAAKQALVLEGNDICVSTSKALARTKFKIEEKFGGLSVWSQPLEQKPGTPRL